MLEEKVAIKDKLNLTISEAAEYSNVGQNTIRGLLRERGCPFLLMVGTKQLVKRKEFERYLAGVQYL